MTQPVCYLDLDGVLVDFVAGALAIHGADIEPGQVRWDFWTQLGMDESAFWAPMGFDFWAGLGWTAEGKELLHGVEAIFGEKVLLMTSGLLPGAVEGKATWIRRELPEYTRRFFVGAAKHLTAGPGKVLLDDHDGNTDRFAAHGGRAVLVPRSWNRRRAEAHGGRFNVPLILEELRLHQGEN